jgi:tetratricopeptide (TPR) repeat protein
MSGATLSRIAVLCAFWMFVVSPPLAAEDDRLAQATKLILKLCIATGRVEITKKGDSIEVAGKQVTPLQIDRSTYSGLVGGISKEITVLQAQQASEARSCTQRYLQKLLDIIFEDKPPAAVTSISANEAVAKADAAYDRKDYAEAMRWYYKAVDQGNVYAQNGIGVLYLNGLGVAQDYAEGMRWFRRAADQGDARGQELIGEVYLNGWGVAQDYAEAMRWFRKAADQRDSPAETNIGFLYGHGWGVAQDYAAAMHWYRKAADQGDALAQYNVGVFYEHGLGVAQDHAEAVRWFRKAADQGYAAAKNHLAKFP